MKKEAWKNKETFLEVFPDFFYFGFESIRDWLEKTWEIYGFDYDTENLGVIWPFDVTLEELKRRLEEDNINYEEFDVDTERYFGRNALIYSIKPNKRISDFIKKESFSLNEAIQYYSEGFDVELICSKNPERPYVYLVDDDMGSFVCSYCSMNVEEPEFELTHEFVAPMTLKESSDKYYDKIQYIKECLEYYGSGNFEELFDYEYSPEELMKQAKDFIRDKNKYQKFLNCCNKKLGTLNEIIRKVGNEYVLYSKKKNPKTGKRRVLGREKTREAIEKREAQVNYFKHKG